MDSTVTVQLFAEARAGSPEAMDALYRRAAARLLPFIRMRLGRSLRSEAESRDILQSVLLKSVQKLDQVQNGGALMGWLIRIAENEIRDLADYATRQRRDVAQRRPIEDAAEVPAVVRQALSQAILNEDTVAARTRAGGAHRRAARDRRPARVRGTAVRGRGRAGGQDDRRVPDDLRPGARRDDDPHAGAAVTSPDLPDIEERFARYVERHITSGTAPSDADLEAIVADRPDLLPEMRALAAAYWQLTAQLDGTAVPAAVAARHHSPAFAWWNGSAAAAWARSTSSRT